MKLILAALGVLIALVVGFFLGGGVFGAAGASGGMIVGSTYGACSVIRDAVEQKLLNPEQGEQYFARFGLRMETLLKQHGIDYSQKTTLSQCEAEIDKFRAEVAKAKK
jgi:hypothetical protein